MEVLNFRLAKRGERAKEHAMALCHVVTQIDATELFAKLEFARREKAHLAGYYDSVIDKLSFAWVSKMGYIAGLATTTQRGSSPTTPQVVEAVLAKLIEVFESWNAMHYMESVAEGCKAIEQRSEQATVSLEDDCNKRIAAQHRAALYTRFGAGNIGDNGLLALHERVAIAVFEPQRDRYCSEIGFCPSDLVRIANTYARLRIAGTPATRQAPSHEPELSEPDTSASYPLMSGCLWSVGEVAEAVNITRAEASSMLNAFCTEFDAHKGMLLPGDPNPCQRQPLLRVSGDTYVVPHFALIPPAVYSWTIHRARTAEGTTTVAGQFARLQRPRATENIVANALRQVFADDTVFPNMEYGEARLKLAGEVDCIVDAAVPVIVEAKDLKLFDEGRRGDMAPVERVAKGAFGRAYDQLARARRFIVDEGGRTFRPRHDDQSSTALQLATNIPDTVSILITFEEQSGVGGDAWAFTPWAHPPPVWTTSLSAFILVCDHLAGDPAAFFHYARTRQQRVADGFHDWNDIHAFAEYLFDRFSGATSDTEGWLAPEHPHWTELRTLTARLSSYYAQPSDPLTRPQVISGVPTEITEALSDCAGRHPLEWIHAAEAVMLVPPHSWHKWRRHCQRHAGREIPFLLPGGNMQLVLSTTRNAPLLSAGPPLTLHVPSRTGPGSRCP